MGVGGVASRILNHGSRWRWVNSLTLRPLFPVPFEEEAGSTPETFHYPLFSCYWSS